MTQKELRIFVNSFSLFLSSFLFIKLALLGAKFIIASVTGIDPEIYTFTLEGINAVNSRAWTQFAVVGFYSIEIIILLLFFVIFLVNFNLTVNHPGFGKFIYFWLMISSLILLLGSIIASILTKQNFYHGLNWLYVPYYVMLIIALMLFIVTFLLGITMNGLFLKFRASEIGNSIVDYSGLARAYTISALLPICFGLLILYLPLVGFMRKYDLVEISVILIFVLSGFVLSMKKKSRKLYKDIITDLYLPPIIFSSITYLMFIVLRIFL